MKNVLILLLLISLNAFGQKQKTVFIVADNSEEIFVEKKNDSVYTTYGVLGHRAHDLINARKSNGVIQTMSADAYRKIQKQILDKKAIAALSDDQLHKVLTQNKIYVIDVSNKKSIKKVPVKASLVIIMP